jgi:hypothetical protein
MKFLTLSTNFEDYSSIKIHENPRSGTELFHAEGRTEGPSDMTKLIVTVRNFANVPKNPCSVNKEDQLSRLYMDQYSAA